MLTLNSYLSAEKVAPFIKHYIYEDGSFFMHRVFMIETSFVDFLHFHRCLLPLQVGSIGFWVHVFLQVVTDVHQNLVINPSPSTECRGQNNYLVQSLELTPFFFHTYSYYNKGSMFRQYDKGVREKMLIKPCQRYCFTKTLLYSHFCLCNRVK